MGGHGHHIAGNLNNTKEDDKDIVNRIRPIELIKHNPQVFHLSFFDLCNQFEVAGGVKTLGFALVGGWVSYSYFVNAMRSRPYNFYVNLHQGFLRFMFGFGVGGAWGMSKFGDRQKLHNAYVAERLRRRYPESMSLKVDELWQYKDVPATHEFYRWR